MDQQTYLGKFFEIFCHHMKTLLVLFPIFIILGAGCNTPPENIPTAEDHREEVIEDDVVIDPGVCLEEPIQTDDGRLIYPIAQEYAHLGVLGQIFTAEACGGKWTEDIFGVEDGMYTLGISLRSKGHTTGVNTAEVLVDIGFACEKEVNYPEDCVDWVLENPVPLDALLRIKGAASEFKSDDCIHC